MTFSRVKSIGWTDDVDTITAAQITQIDVNQSRSLDGTGGGTYTPTGAPLVINGTQGLSLGTDGNAGLVTCRQTGTYTKAGSAARTVWRTLTISADADVTVDVTTDLVELPNGTATPRIVTMRHSTAPIPVAGEIVWFSRPAAASAWTIRREGAGGSIITFPSGVSSTGAVRFNGTVWKLHMAGAGTTPGADA